MPFQAQVGHAPARDVRLTRREGRRPSLLQIDGQDHAVSLQATGDAALVRIDDRTERVWIAVEHDAVHIHAFGQAWRVEVVDSAMRAAAGAEEADVHHAPMPGVVVALHVGAGDAVAPGGPLLVIESMKMQSEIVAWRDGVVRRTPHAVGDTFDRGAVLVELEPIATDGKPVS